MTDHNQEHWLARPRTIGILWRGFYALLTLTVMVQLLIYVKGYFTVDGWFGFGAIFGFLSCLLMVLFAKGLGALLKRPNDYYVERDDDA